MGRSTHTDRPASPDVYCWRPSPLQRHLLGLALADPGEAAHRRGEYLALAQTFTLRGREAVIGDDVLDWGTARLLPLVAWQAHRAGVAPSAMLPLSRHLAAAMVARRSQDAHTARIVGLLAEQGIDALVLKGGGLGALAYPDPGTRPMSDVDLLIRPRDIDAVRAWIADVGGTIDFTWLEGHAVRRFRHSATVNVPAGELDLHWRTLYHRFDEGPDEVLWDHAVEIRVGGTVVRTPAPHHHLVHTIVHGMLPNYLAPLRWITDAVLLTRVPSFDWDLFVEDALRRKIGALVSHGLQLLEDLQPGTVPPHVVGALHRNGPIRMELFSRELSRSRLRGVLNNTVVLYLLGSATWGPVPRALHFPSWLRFSVESGIVSTPARRRRLAAAVAELHPHGVHRLPADPSAAS
jgi:hypothetical protein